MTIKQQAARDEVVENGGNVSKAMIKVGYSPATAKTPQKLTESKGWKEMMDIHLPDEMLLLKHREQLNSTAIGHMVFPTDFTEEAATEMLESVNCKPNKFSKRDNGLHVWFFVANAKARQDALALAYKIKGKIVDNPDINIMADKVAVIVVEGGDAENPDGNQNIRSL